MSPVQSCDSINLRNTAAGKKQVLVYKMVMPGDTKASRDHPACRNSTFRVWGPGDSLYSTPAMQAYRQACLEAPGRVPGRQVSFC